MTPTAKDAGRIVRLPDGRTARLLANPTPKLARVELPSGYVVSLELEDLELVQ